MNMYLMCPECGSKMILRKGPHGEFYGCSQFPMCEYTIDEMGGEFLKELQEDKLEDAARRDFFRMGKEKTNVREIIQKIENLEGKEKESLSGGEREEFKKLEWKLGDIMKQTEEKEEEQRLRLSAGEGEGKISKFSLKNQIPEFLWWNVLFHKKNAEFTNLELRIIQKLERTFNQKIETQFSYDEIISLLENIKGEIERTFKIVRVPRNIERFFKEELSETNHILQQVERNCEINRARYELGQANYEKGLDDLRNGHWQKANWGWKEAVRFLKKISPRYKKHCKSWLMSVDSDGSDSLGYYEDSKCENVQEEVKKVFGEIKRIKEEKKEKREKILKNIGILEDDIKEAKEEAKRIKNELGEMLKKLRQQENYNVTPIKYLEALEAKEEEIEKNQYFRLVNLLLTDLSLVENIGILENVVWEFEIEPKHEYVPGLFSGMFSEYKMELERISDKIEGKEGPVRFMRFIGFPGACLPEELCQCNLYYLEELIKKMKLSASNLVEGRPDLEKRLQDLKQKVKSIKIEIEV